MGGWSDLITVAGMSPFKKHLCASFVVSKHWPASKGAVGEHPRIGICDRSRPFFLARVNVLFRARFVLKDVIGQCNPLGA